MEVQDPPAIAALFEVVFDQKVGYTISWKRALPDIDLDGLEYKCLPSGLHGVEKDLVYFIHGECAGVSAFVRGEADERHRNANFVAVGVLVPLSYGRLGKSWSYAEALRQLASERVRSRQDARGLELFWMKHRQDGSSNGPETTSPSAPESNRKRKRATSDVSGHFSSPDSLSSDHPALSMVDLLDTFGPLTFPLYRLALLHKRILLLGTAPVNQTCDFIYLLSILSNIPQTVAETLQSDTEASLRIQTLFSVGVHDIPSLAEKKEQRGWLACTTDDILGEKKDLYDVLVKLPSFVTTAQTKQWPQIHTADGLEIKATQRDLRRYRLLRSELNRTTSSRTAYREEEEDTTAVSDRISTSLSRASTQALVSEAKHAEPGDQLVCEPVTWTAMAYNGFMWWASAGEMEAWQNEEAREDRQLLDALPETEELLRHMSPESTSHSPSNEIQLKMAEATVLTAYFHRLTSDILQPLIDSVEDADDDTEEGVADVAINVSNEDVRAMGLDTWSTADREFVVQALELYFGREAKLIEDGVRVCGVKIC